MTGLGQANRFIERLKVAECAQIATSRADPVRTVANVRYGEGQYGNSYARSRGNKRWHDSSSGCNPAKLRT
jgi:hypothetical protein